jgi:tetratricopeptide (TPR) repeat protein
MLGNFPDGRDLLVRGRETLRDLGLRYWPWVGLEGLWQLEMLAGDPVAAEREARFGYDANESTVDPGIRSSQAARLAHAVYEQGRYEEAIGYADISKDAASAAVWEQVLWRSAKAKALARLGELQEALVLAHRAVTLVQGTDALNLHADALMDQAEVLILAENRGEAAKALEEALALYKQKGNVVSAGKAQAIIDEVR